MHVCICVLACQRTIARAACAHICVYMCVRACQCTIASAACAHARVHACACVSAYDSICMCVYMCARVSAHNCICSLRMRLCAHVCLRACDCTIASAACAHACMYVCMHGSNTIDCFCDVRSQAWPAESEALGCGQVLCRRSELCAANQNSSWQ